jgi:hypothetical protein
MCSFTRFICRRLIGPAFILFGLKPLALFDGNNILPAHVVLDVADGSELRQKVLSAQGGTNTFSSLGGFMVLGAVQNVIKVHFIEFLILLTVILVEPGGKSSDQLEA